MRGAGLEQQVELVVGDGIVVAWVPVAAIRQRADIRRVYRGVTLRRCSCGWLLAPEAIRCLCKEEAQR